MRWILIAAVLLATRPAFADAPRIEVEKYQLANGIEVILAPDKTVPLVAVSVWYHVGSGNETPGKRGFAHLFEHMMFQGSKNTGPDSYMSILRRIGASGFNGTTNADRTNYFQLVPANQVETVLWLESDRMGYLLEMVSRGELENQIEVVRNERRERYETKPYRKALFPLFAALYPEGHPYRHLPIGKPEDLASASLDDMKAFFKTWYVPSNATLAVVGDFELPQMKKAVEKWFGTFPVSKKPATLRVPAPHMAAATIEVDDDLAKLHQVVYVWHSPALYGDGDAELEIAASALGSEGRGSLYKALVLDKGLAESVSVSQDGAQHSGTFDVTVTLRSGADLVHVQQIVVDELTRLSKETLPRKEIARVVAMQEAGALFRLESLLARADALQAYNHYLGDPDKLSWDLDRFRRATPESIRATFAKYIVPTKMITVLSKPARTKK